MIFFSWNLIFGWAYRAPVSNALNFSLLYASSLVAFMTQLFSKGKSDPYKEFSVNSMLSQLCWVMIIDILRISFILFYIRTRVFLLPKLATGAGRYRDGLVDCFR